MGALPLSRQIELLIFFGPTNITLSRCLLFFSLLWSFMYVFSPLLDWVPSKQGSHLIHLWLFLKPSTLLAQGQHTQLRVGKDLVWHRPEKKWPEERGKRPFSSSSSEIYSRVSEAWVRPRCLLCFVCLWHLKIHMLKSNLQDDSSVLGGGDFGRWLGLQDETLMGFVLLLKEAPESSIAPLALWGKCILRPEVDTEFLGDLAEMRMLIHW